MIVGIAYAACGSVCVAAGHYAMSRGHANRDERLRLFGLVLAEAGGAIFDYLANSRAPRLAVAPVGTLVVAWSIVISAHRSGKRPRVRDCVRTVVIVGGAGVVAWLAPPDDARSEPRDAAAYYAFAWLALACVHTRPWTVGGFNGCVGPFFKAYQTTGRLVHAPPALAIAALHAAWLKEIAVGEQKTFAPAYFASQCLSGGVAAVVGFGTYPDRPIAFALAAIASAIAAAADRSERDGKSVTAWSTRLD